MFHDMTSVDVPLTFSAAAFHNQDGGSFMKLWTDFLIKMFRVSSGMRTIKTLFDLSSDWLLGKWSVLTGREQRSRD